MTHGSSLDPELAAKLEEYRVELSRLPLLKALEQISSSQWLLPTIGIRLGLGPGEAVTRQDILKWLFGTSAPTSALTYVRVPSRAKRVLASQLVASGNRWRPGLTGRLLHVYAFRREYLSQAPSRSQGQKTAAIAPAYKRREVPRAGRRPRVIYVPNARLKRIQRDLLRVFSGQCEKLLRSHDSSHVLLSKTVVENAAHHLGQRFVVTLDLKDFFGSIRFDHIVRTLCSLREPLIPDTFTASEPSSRWARSPGSGEETKSVERLPCDRDAAVLIAGLTTHQRVLPQGAPTSPLIADLVFSRYDRSLARALAGRFSQGVRFSRYFDDLTFSLPTGARVLDSGRWTAIASPNEARRYIVALVREVLSRSPFRLNDTKTRAADIQSSGIEITGLHVTATSLSVTRTMRRNLRALMYRVKNEGLWKTATAIDRNPLHLHPDVRFDSKRVGFFARGRRVSQERLLAEILVSFIPNLKIEIQSSSASANGVSTRTGQSARRASQRILHELWADRLYAIPRSDASVLIIDKDKKSAAISGDRNVAIFALPKEQAWQVLEYLLVLRGMLGFLGGCAVQGGPYQRLAKLGEAVASHWKNLELRWQGPFISGGVKEPVDGERVEIDDDLERNLEKLRSALDDFAFQTGAAPDTKFRKLVPCIVAKVRKARRVEDLVDALRPAFDDLKVLPRMEPEDSKLLLAICIKGDLRERRRSRPSEYIASLAPIEPYARQSFSPERKAKLCAEFARPFQRAVEDARHIDISEWRGSLERNLFRGPRTEMEMCHERLLRGISSARAVDRVLVLLGPDFGRRLDDLSGRELLLQGLREGEKGRDHLFRASTLLVREVLEALGGASQDPTGSADSLFQKLRRSVGWEAYYSHGGEADLKRSIRALIWARNLDVHAPSQTDESRRSEWLAVQRSWATVLGKSLRFVGSEKRLPLFQVVDLDLTEFEVLKVKAGLVRSATEFLELWLQCQESPPKDLSAGA